MSGAPDRPSLTAVVSTIGRPAPLLELVRSLQEAAHGLQVELVVVDQSPDRCALAALEAEPPTVPYVAATSQRGVSLGRNTGAALAGGDIVTFPDDNCWYAPDSLRQVVTAFGEQPALAVLSGIQRTRDGEGSMLRWAAQACAITRKNVDHTAIESGTFYRRDRFDSFGGFDETIGLGSPGPYQAGEGTDLLLRMLAAGELMRYDPAIVVYQDDPREAPPAGFSRRMRGYGRGYGLLNRRHHLPRRDAVRAVARKVAAAGVRGVSGKRAQARSDLAWAYGVVEGVTGRDLSWSRPGAGRDLDDRAR